MGRRDPRRARRSTLVAAAVRPPPAPLRDRRSSSSAGLGSRSSSATGSSLGSPDEGLGNVHIGPYLALAALAAATIGLLAAWPRAGSVALLVAAAAGLVAALFSDWGREGDYNGFERWHVLDVALLALALGLLVAAAGKAPRALRWLLALGALAAAACVLAASDTQIWIGDGGTAEGAALGALVALLSLTAAVAGLALQCAALRTQRAAASSASGGR